MLSSAAALLDGLFEQPAKLCPVDLEAQTPQISLKSVLLKPMIELSGPQHGFRGAPCQVFSC